MSGQANRNIGAGVGDRSEHQDSCGRCRPHIGNERGNASHPLSVVAGEPEVSSVAAGHAYHHEFRPLRHEALQCLRAPLAALRIGAAEVGAGDRQIEQRAGDLAMVIKRQFLC